MLFLLSIIETECPSSAKNLPRAKFEIPAPTKSNVNFLSYQVWSKIEISVE